MKDKQKDPACLFFIADWLKNTKDLKADERGWYLNLLLHQYDKGDLPNDIEELANFADVRHSEYAKFEHVFEHVLKQRFNMLPNGRLCNEMAKVILQERTVFKEKRTYAGKISYIIKYFKSNYSKDAGAITYIKERLKEDGLIEQIDTKNEHMLNTCLNKMFNTYLNTSL